MNRSEVQLYETLFEHLKKVDDRGEHWFARELMPYAGYVDWRNFQNAINRAKTALAGDGTDVREHFSVTPPKTSDRGGRPRADIRLSRRGCYLLFMNGDPEKEPIAAAQNYFATKARQMELAEQTLLSDSAMPTHIEALRGWADALEDLQRAEEAARRAQAEAEELRPPAEAWRALAATGGDCSIAEAAAVLNRAEGITTGPQRLTRWLQEIKVVYRRNNGQLVPYSGHQAHVRLRPTESGRIELRLTPAALEWIMPRLRQEQNRPSLGGSPRMVIAPRR